MNLHVSHLNLYSMLKTYNANKQRIHAALRGEDIEHYGKEDKKVGVSANKNTMGMILFWILLLIQVALFIWAVAALAMFGDQLTTPAMVVGIITLLFGFPMITLVSVYAGRRRSGTKK